jgi:7-alpha-hydroxysteroid dehydrogenase
MPVPLARSVPSSLDRFCEYHAYHDNLYPIYRKYDVWTGMTIYDLFRLDGRVALITGGGGGLGSAMARAFAEAGADIAVVGRSRETLEAVRDDVVKRGRRCAVVPGDVSRPEQLAHIVDETVAQLGRLDILCNNVGGIAGDDAPLPAMAVTDESWVAQVELNLTSVWRLTKVAVPRMKDGGVVLNMSSIKAYHPAGGSAAYGAAKAGLNNLTLALSGELAPAIRVVGIAPGPVPTDKFKEVRGVTEADYPRIAREWGVPLERLGSPEEIAAAALFLVSPAAGWITGQTLIVAGGM